MQMEGEVNPILISNYVTPKYLRCLAEGHDRGLCMQPVRCKNYFNYGHIQRFYLNRASPKIFWSHAKRKIIRK
uniref:Uncharacterized protein n=1 Tax=Arundo donax TaxID=35708 RepID=A0A0A8YA33_ARUDO